MSKIDVLSFTDEQIRKFLTADPFPHIVIDDAFDQKVALDLEHQFPSLDSKVWSYMRNEFEHKMASENPKSWPRQTRHFLQKLNSDEQVKELEKLSQTEELLSDDTYRGGGLHCMPPEGFLNIHLDFNKHNGKYPTWTRKLNLLYFLNKDWEEEWNGDLELWNGDECVKKVSPKFNRVVIFETSDKSWHGLPKKIKTPEGVARKSFALYYYVDEPTVDADTRGTQFKKE